MGSKKHKKESKKKKHRSRSRSPLEGEEQRERKRHHKKHKDRKKDRSPDVEEVPVDSHLIQEESRHSGSAEHQRERDYAARDSRTRDNGDTYYEPSSSYYSKDKAPDSYYNTEYKQTYERGKASDAFFKDKDDLFQRELLSYQKDRERELSSYKEKYDNQKDKESSYKDYQKDKESSSYKDYQKEKDSSYKDYQKDKDSSSYKDYQKEKDSSSYKDYQKEKDSSYKDYQKDKDSSSYKDYQKEKDSSYKDYQKEKDSSYKDYQKEKETSSYKERSDNQKDKESSSSYERAKASDAFFKEPNLLEKPAEHSKAQDSMSIEDTNKLRAKLGLKPLEVSDQMTEDGKYKDDLGEFYHRPATNIAAQKKGEKIKQKLDERKEKRKLEQKLQATATLAEGEEDDDALAWVRKSRDIEKQKKDAAKRAAMLDEMDAVFGVSALVAEEVQADKAASYTDRQLKGLRVAHDLDSLDEERVTILTLADKEVLAEDTEDVLVNVNLIDNDKYRKNIEERKKARSGYQAYDDEADLEAAALGYSRPLLAKYDDELQKEEKAKQKGFFIGDEAAIEAKRFRDMMRQERLAGGPDKRLESLVLPPLRPASQYYDEAEIQAKFKKHKKKGKGIRKKAKEEPIDVDDYDAGAVPLQTDDTEVKLDQLGANLVVEEEEVEVDSELQIALARARRLRQAERARDPVPKVEDLLQRVKEEESVKMEEEDPGEGSSAMVLDATAEFCRTLGDIPTYGQAGNRDHQSEIMDFERDEDLEPLNAPDTTGAWSRVDVEKEEPADITAGDEDLERGVGGVQGHAPDTTGAWSRVDVEEEEPADITAGMLLYIQRDEDLEPLHAPDTAGAWSRVDVEKEEPADITAGSTVVLEPEPALGAGVAGALQLALSKGYLEKTGLAPAPRPTNVKLLAQSYSIEDKTIGEDDKHGRRGREHYHGPLGEFREKAGFKPRVKLEYVDDDGRPLCPKEAFRYLSHKFHGKGPGKNKQEKRIKKQIQEGLMKKMSSTDTPLNTLQMLQEKQRETHSAYVVLSGGKRDNNT